MLLLSRDEYELYHKRLLQSAGMGEQDIAFHFERMYPIGTEGVIHELRQRGLDATPWRIEAWAQKHDNRIRHVGKTRVWYRSDIDALAEELEREGKLTPLARVARDEGLSLPDLLRILDELRDNRREVVQ